MSDRGALPEGSHGRHPTPEARFPPWRSWGSALWMAQDLGGSADVPSWEAKSLTHGSPLSEGSQTGPALGALPVAPRLFQPWPLPLCSPSGDLGLITSCLWLTPCTDATLTSKPWVTRPSDLPQLWAFPLSVAATHTLKREQKGGTQRTPVPKRPQCDRDRV